MCYHGLFSRVCCLHFAAGGVLHAVAYFSKAHLAIESAGVKQSFGNELKVLWLADSTPPGQSGSGVGTCVASARLWEQVALLLLIVPGAITILLYAFLGPFYAARLLLIGSSIVVIAALLLKDRPSLDAPAGAQWRRSN